MVYTPTNWINGTTPINAINLNHLEAGVEAASSGGSGPWVSAEADFGVETGAVADRTVNTTACNAFLNYLAVNQARGYWPHGEIQINSKLNIPRRLGWSFEGAGMEGTTIRQYADNTPVIDLGTDTASEMHSWSISKLGLDYNNTQSTAQTNADCIRYSQMGYEGKISEVSFKKGRRGIGLNLSGSAIQSPWGITHTDLIFGSALTKSAIDNSTNFTTGAPNNVYGRILADATNMVGPVFALLGENGKIDAIEILKANQGAQLLDIYDGSTFDIGTIKVEEGVYDASQTAYYFRTNTSCRVGYLRITGVIVNNAAVLTAIKTEGGGSGTLPSIILGRLDANATFNGTSKGYAAQVGVGHRLEADDIELTKNGGTSAGVWRKHDSGNTDTADGLRIKSEILGRTPPAGLANANYAVTQISTTPYNVFFFETAFTAQRDFDLPANPDELWNGLWYKIIPRNGAINGANTLRIRCNGTTLRTQSTDNVALTYMWRRNADPTIGWKLVDVSSLA